MGDAYSEHWGPIFQQSGANETNSVLQNRHSYGMLIFIKSVFILLMFLLMQLSEHFCSSFDGQPEVVGKSNFKRPGQYLNAWVTSTQEMKTICIFPPFLSAIL